jgi:multicomponent Na+:H+ antiporter subunit B
MGAILPRLTLDETLAYLLVPTRAGPIAGGLGLLLFLVVGALPLLVGGAFLDYGALEIGGMEASRVRYLGILVVEIGVGLAVFGALLLLFDVLAGRGRE